MNLFDKDIALTNLENGRFSGTVSDNWSVNGNPNGGYLLAMIAGAMMRVSDKKATPILTANYLSRCVPGPVEILSLFLIIDAMPPAVMASQGVTAWVPTIELSVNIRNLPQTRRLQCSLRTRFITCGLLEADGEVWDEAGNLAAISRQIAQFKKR